MRLRGLLNSEKSGAKPGGGFEAGTLKEYPTKRLAERELERRLSRVNHLDYRPKRVCTFREFAELWRSRVASQYKPSTKATVNSHLRTHLLPKLGKKIVGDIDSFDIQDFVSSVRLKASKRAQKPTLPASGKTVKSLISALRLMRRSAVAWNLTDRDWFTGLILPEWIKPESRHFTLAEARAIINTADEPFKTFFWIIAETGIRLGEACALRPRDFRLDLRGGGDSLERLAIGSRRINQSEKAENFQPVPRAGRTSGRIHGQEERVRIPLSAVRCNAVAGRSHHS